MASGMEIEEKDFGRSGVGGGGLGLAAAGNFLEDLWDIRIGHIGFAEPVEDQVELSLHFDGSSEFGEEKRIGKALKFCHGGLSFFEERHSVGSGQGVEH